jgi:hypothetical protein
MLATSVNCVNIGTGKASLRRTWRRSNLPEGSPKSPPKFKNPTDRLQCETLASCHSGITRPWKGGLQLGLRAHNDIEILPFSVPAS